MFTVLIIIIIRFPITSLLIYRVSNVQFESKGVVTRIRSETHTGVKFSLSPFKSNYNLHYDKPKRFSQMDEPREKSRKVKIYLQLNRTAVIDEEWSSIVCSKAYFFVISKIWINRSRLDDANKLNPIS